MGLPLVIIHFRLGSEINQPAIGYPHDYGTPQAYLQLGSVGAWDQLGSVEDFGPPHLHQQPMGMSWLGWGFQENQIGSFHPWGCIYSRPRLKRLFNWEGTISILDEMTIGGVPPNS